MSQFGGMIRSMAAALLLGVVSTTGAQAAYKAYVCGLKPSDPTLNLRACPNKGCDVIVAVPNGTGVIVYRRAGGGWVYGQTEGLEGYLSSKYLCR